MSLDVSTLFTSLLPDTIDNMTATILIISAAFTSMLTAALGAGGGVMLLAALALTLPPAAIIPVHGLVQMGSNVNRAIMTWRHIHWQTILWFLPGVILGAWLASLFLMQLSLETLQLTIAGFIFFLCWGPKLPKMALSRPGIFIASLITSFAAMFAGASGRKSSARKSWALISIPIIWNRSFQPCPAKRSKVSLNSVINDIVEPPFQT